VIEVGAIVEGKTERAFVNDYLAAHLGALGVFIWARLPGRLVRRGGVHPWDAVRRDIVRTLAERRGRICTTMFDFYAMPGDWPGRAEAAGMPLENKGPHVEEAMLNDLAAHAGEGFRREVFMPYVQVHEFEALLFADTAVMAEVLASTGAGSQAELNARLHAVVEGAGWPEAINDHRDTCPSRRITAIAPAYRKAVFGPLIAGRIGLEVLRKACPHFGHWVTRLESLGAE
jgi:hypothetical protein